MPRNRTDMRIASTERMIAAAVSEFAAAGFTGARIENMAAGAGVSKGLYSQRFSSKTALYTEALKKQFDLIGVTDSQYSLISAFSSYADRARSVLKNNQESFLFLNRYLNDADIPQESKRKLQESFFATSLEKEIRKSMERGELPGGEPYPVFLAYLRSVYSTLWNMSSCGLPIPDNAVFLSMAGFHLPISEEKMSFIYSLLAEDYEDIIYVTVSDCAENDTEIVYRSNSSLAKMIPNWDSRITFHDRLDIISGSLVHPEDRARFISQTRRTVILKVIEDGSSYCVEFRTLVGGTVGNHQLRFVPDKDTDGRIIGFIAGLRDIETENNTWREEQYRTNIINVLASGYNAVYYCDAVSHGYDIVYQQGFVREQLLQMLKALPKFEDAFMGYINGFVYPDDREMMMKEINLFSEKLKGKKSYTVEFRRKYAESYFYTEMKVVKIAEADEPLGYFVVGFEENDAEYRSLSERQKQLESAVAERTWELQERNRSLNRINEEITELLGNITEARDVESGEHIRRVKGYTYILATQFMNDWPEYNLTKGSVALMTSASALHDIGKIMISDTILLKPGKLTPEEFETMKTHCEKGCEMLSRAPSEWSDSYLRVSLEICRCHHEKWDGNGYPAGLKGDEIPVSAQIVSVADCFDALSSKRVYKDAYGLEESFEMIMNGECGAFSPKLLSSFKACKEELFAHTLDRTSVIASSMPVGISTSSLSWMKILIADDNPNSIALCLELLENEGAEVVTARSGMELVDIFCSNALGSFDAVLFSLSISDIPPEEIVRKLKASCTGFAGSPAIIGITSTVNERVIDNLLVEGMDSYLMRPIAISSLNRVLRECMSSQSEALENAVAKADGEAFAVLETALSRSGILSSNYRDYDLACYINGATNTIQCFRFSEQFERIMSTISTRLPSNRRLDLFLRIIVPEKNFNAFLADTNRNRITEYLRRHDCYQLFIPVNTDGTESLEMLKIVEDDLNKGCYILVLQNVNTDIGRDGLTGVKNAAAFKETCRKLNERIAYEPGIKFGIAVFDVNSLHRVNSKFGREMGDRYITNCSRIICDVFKRSPVYRIGGGMFAAVLEGYDYRNSEILLSELLRLELKAEKTETIEQGKAAFAIGYAAFNDSGCNSAHNLAAKAEFEMRNSKT